MGPILRPVATVTLEANAKKAKAVFYVDSGADITTIPLRIGKALNLKHEPKDILREMRGISGGGVPYLLKKIFLIFNHERIKARVAWALIDEVPMLLGRCDVFSKFDVLFQERKTRILLSQKELEAPWVSF